MLTTQNTTGYTDAELAALNQEWEERSLGLDPDSDEYHDAYKAFCDEVAKRSPA